MNPALGTALLVGGSSQIGFAVLVELLGPPPRRVVLAGRPSAALWRNADQLRDAGYQVSTIQYDASLQPDEIDGLLEHLTADHQLGLALIAVGRCPRSPSATRWSSTGWLSRCSCGP